MDSIGYQKEFENLNNIKTELDILYKKIQTLGYFDANFQTKINANNQEVIYKLGKKTNLIIINIPKEVLKYIDGFSLNNNKINLKPIEIEGFMNAILQNYDKEGLGFIDLQLTNFIKINENLNADLTINKTNKRIVNQLVINGYSKFTKGHYKRLKRNYLNQDFSQDLVKKISKNLDQINFVKQIKYPEVLFKKDSTLLYIYLEKENNNQFDGFMGFSNSERGGFIFTGYLDLKLQNIVNSGEKLQINWRNDGNNQSSFLVDLSLPLLFNTSFGVETSLHVFRQDSLFQNSKTNLKINYLFPNEMKVAIGLLQNSSNSINKIDPVNIQDFENTFYNLNYNFSKNNYNDILFPEVFMVDFNSGIGNRNTKNNKISQYFLRLNTSYHHKWNDKNSFWIKNSNFYLKSNGYLINELERFGGIYSIRGFQENSLQANVMTSLSAEYRYRLSPDLYLHTVSDYAFYEDATNAISQQIYGLGLGLGLYTKNGLFKLNYATGFEKNLGPSFQNSLIHFSFISRF